MILEEIEELLTKLIKEKYAVDKVNIVLTNRPDLCDYQINEVFLIAKNNKLNPIIVGEDIVKSINEYPDFSSYFKKVEFVKPGFINITLSDYILAKNVDYMINNPKFGLKTSEKCETYFLDYGGPNIAKPLHVGHMRTAVVGEAIKRIINYYGNKTIGDVHFGDYGLQIGEVIYGLRERNIAINDITLELLEEIYPAMSKLCKENEDIMKICAEITKDLQDGNELYHEYLKKICEVSISDIKRIYDYLSVKFDLWLGESDCYDVLPEVENVLNDKKLLEESNGAMVIYVDEEEDKQEVPPFLFKKSNGAYLYQSTDLATIYKRERDYKPDHILYVVDNRQSLHFKQVFRAADKSNISKIDKLEHLGYGTVNGADGKPYKTRSGETPKLDNLFTEIKDILKNKNEKNENMSDADIDILVNSILKFADLQNSRERDYIFDLAKFSDVTGKTGPYILYTYLRINKIIKDKEINKNILTNEIYNNYERDLKLKLLEYQNVLDSAFINRMPNYIADYIYELCVLINTFYQNNHINSLDDIVKQNNWVNLLTLTNSLINEMLSLLAIDIPTEM